MKIVKIFGGGVLPLRDRAPRHGGRGYEVPNSKGRRLGTKQDSRWNRYTAGKKQRQLIHIASCNRFRISSDDIFLKLHSLLQFLMRERDNCAGEWIGFRHARGFCRHRRDLKRLLQRRPHCPISRHRLSRSLLSVQLLCYTCGMWSDGGAVL